ncbi:MAG: hypothetical protein LBD64_00865 [Odoribacteraceae bacterium]|jgi:hypothetical protein|nr:hypothetical protein [Odoribacteraceae bacterium]
MGYLTTKNSTWIEWVKGFYATCIENANVWELDEKWLKILSTLVGEAVEAYETNLPWKTRNHETVVAKNEAFEKLRMFLRKSIPVLFANPRISNERLVDMGFRSRERVRPRTLPRPSKSPMLAAVCGKQQVVDIYTSAEPLDRSIRVRENEGYSIIIRYKIEGEVAWHELYSSLLHVQLPFGARDVKKRLTLMVAWVNPRLERGPWSASTTVIIS